ncbi:MAG: hypothetical protein M9894_23815 [Planctomycetes bacterium]|nr:hypothetical protein [Planctomycetota bacterium]
MSSGFRCVVCLVLTERRVVIEPPRLPVRLCSRACEDAYRERVKETQRDASDAEAAGDAPVGQ